MYVFTYETCLWPLITSLVSRSSSSLSFSNVVGYRQWAYSHEGIKGLLQKTLARHSTSSWMFLNETKGDFDTHAWLVPLTLYSVTDFSSCRRNRCLEYRVFRSRAYTAMDG
jgi:hypothetical protein